MLGAKTITIDYQEHPIGDESCAECWGGFPRHCKCGGLIHANFGDYVGFDYYLNKLCDKCGPDYASTEDR